MGIFVTDAVEEEAKIEKQGNPKPTIGAPAPPTGRSPYDDKGNYHHEWTYERD
jgi:hypothetical protein